LTALFTYSNPRRVHWGPGSRRALGELANTALVTTRSLAATAAARLSIDPVAAVVVGQHAPVADVDAGEAAVRESGAETLVSFGGGSPIDAAKLVSIRLGGLTHYAVPTTLSAAELAAGAGMTDAEGNKVGMRDPRGLVDAVVYDPELAVETPLELWLSTGIRALDHAVEGFLAEGRHPYNDVLALEAVRRLFRTLPEAKERPGDVAVRGENQLAAWFSMSLPEASAGGLSHMMGKQIGARHGIPHGVTSCLLLPHVLAYRAQRQPDRMPPLAEAMGGEPSVCVTDLLVRLELPRRISQFGLGEVELRAAAAGVSAAFKGAYPQEDVEAIYLAAL
jgi:maleylacetate reductase